MVQLLLNSNVTISIVEMGLNQIPSVSISVYILISLIAIRCISA